MYLFAEALIYLRSNILYLLTLSCFAISCSSGINKVYDSRLSEYRYPYQVYEFTFSSQRQQLSMSYGDIGHKDSDKVVLLLHGKNFSGYYWNRVARDLVKKGYRVIIPDQIGFGKSSKPKSYQFSFAQLALNTVSLLNSLNIKKFNVVGHSMGGMLAVHLTSMYESRVNQLVLVNPIGLETYLNYVEYKDPEFFYSKELEKTVDMFRNYQMKNYYDGKWSERYEELLEPFKGWRSGGDYELVAWNNALTYGPIFSEDIVSKFEDLKTETILVLGTRDRTGPGRGWKKEGVTRKLGQYHKLGKQIKALNPKNIKLIELDGLGHMPQFEDYKRFSKEFFALF